MTGAGVIVDHRPLTEAVAAIYEHYGLPPDDARLVAEGLVLANLRGVWSHGVARVSMYAERLRRGLIDPEPAIAIERPAPALAHLDGANGIGFVVATRAIDAAMEIAEETGVGVVGVRRSGHYGMAAIYALRAIERGFASFVYTNASPAMPPFGGRVPMLGTNPYAVGIPGGQRGDVVIDMACTVAARGKLKFAAQRGEAIPAGYALDEHGHPTTDGGAAFRGTVLPFGGHKGSALALQLDILCGLMTGAAFGGEVRNPFTGLDGPQDVGHFFLAMRPDLFLGREVWRERMDEMVERLKSTPRAEGVEEVMLPGEIEARTAAERRRSGVPFTPDVWADLEREAELAGVDLPAPVA
ncbi:MAG TPA: Ldh family oxidoreductase, partial [Geminicoccaceae bacterium]|nr:Ldh family oxidoreductase [Geminicoccaceae bacterium]